MNITSNTSTWLHRWTESCYMYEFSLNGKFYTGNSLIKEGESDKIGTKIKIYYFKKFPSFNRPLSYCNYSAPHGMSSYLTVLQQQV